MKSHQRSLPRRGSTLTFSLLQTESLSLLSLEETTALPEAIIRLVLVNLTHVRVILEVRATIEIMSRFVWDVEFHVRLFVFL